MLYIGNESEIMPHNYCNNDMNWFQGMLPSEIELAKFAADVESILGKGL